MDENERLAVLETKVDSLVVVVPEIRDTLKEIKDNMRCDLHTEKILNLTTTDSGLDDRIKRNRQFIFWFMAIVIVALVAIAYARN